MSKKKNKSNKDPFYEREAEKYTNPIPSREFILSHLNEKGAPSNLKQLAEELGIEESNQEQLEALRRRIKAMLRDGQLEQLKKRRYWPSGNHFLIKGKVKFDKGRYWVIPDDGGARIEITSFNNLPVYSDIKVAVSVPNVPNEIYRQGKVVEILETETKFITGRFAVDLDINYVIPHGKEFTHDIIIPKKYKMDAKEGDIVVVNIISHDSKFTEPLGKIVEVLGNENTKGIEVKTVIRAFDIPYKWPKEVSKKITDLKESVPPAAKRNRIDLRDLPLVTIDGEDAKDFDDAVYCEPKKSGGWRLFVAIADVSYYVKANTALDKEAAKRGNSVYFPGTVIPMLPEILSNGLCSLKPEVDRLCMVCEMSISKSGKITRFKFYEAVMNSKARLTYTKVHKLLNYQSKNLTEKYKHLLPHLENLNELYKALRKQREQRGAIDFETVETKIIFNKSGKISKIEPVTRNVAHKIIEECMLAANVATAKFLQKNKVPGIYRVHEAPEEEKVLDLKTFLFELGISHEFGKKPKPIDYGAILKKISQRPDANIIQVVLLRSLSQAVYSPDNVGHFGLAYSEYTHFTSPIRRYPDLLIHRQLKAILNGNIDSSNKKKVEKIQNEFAQLAQHCSITERRADDATRDVQRWLKCQYMEQHLGKTFPGIISSITRFGFFVELEDIYIDGLVHVNTLHDDYYIFNPIHHKLVGESSNKEYKLGMRLSVIVARVDVDERKIDFELEPSFIKYKQEPSTNKKRAKKAEFKNKKTISKIKTKSGIKSKKSKKK